MKYFQKQKIGGIDAWFFNIEMDKSPERIEKHGKWLIEHHANSSNGLMYFEFHKPDFTKIEKIQDIEQALRIIRDHNRILPVFIHIYPENKFTIYIKMATNNFDTSEIKSIENHW